MSPAARLPWFRVTVWVFARVTREVLAHLAEFLFLGLILSLLYFGAYLPRLGEAVAGFSGPTRLALALGLGGLVVLFLLLLAPPLPRGRRVFYAVSGLGLDEEYRFFRYGFAIRNVWMAVLAFLVALPLALAGRGGLGLAALLALACLGCQLLFAGLLFWLKTGPRPGAGREARIRSFQTYASARELWRARPRSRLGLRAALLLGEAKKRLGGALTLVVAVLLETAVALDFIDQGRQGAMAPALLGSRGRAALMFFCAFSSTAFIEYFATADKVFFRILPVSFAVYFRERFLPALALALVVALPLLGPIIFVTPAAAPLALLGTLLTALAAASLGEARPLRPNLAALLLALIGLVAAYFSLSWPIPVFALGFLATALLLARARRRFYREEVER
jgi:hypothetical protein